MEDEAVELQQLAVDDFQIALRCQGSLQAAETLRTYLEELQHGPHEVLLQLATAFSCHAQAAAASGNDTLPDLTTLQTLLLQVVARSGEAVQQVQGVWQHMAAALLYGKEGESAVIATQRLQRTTALWAALLDPLHLRGLPAPATHQQRRSMLVCLLHLQLYPVTGVHESTLAALRHLAAPPWFGQDPEHARRQQAAAFEAFAAVVQQAGDALCSSSARREAALSFLLLFRPSLPAIVDCWWAHFAALLHALVQLALDGGVAALRHTPQQALLRCLCCKQTAHMVVPLVVSHPAYQPEQDTPHTAQPKAAAPRRKKVAASGAAVGTKRALAMAAALLSHDVPSFLAGCCELLRPEADCSLQTRVEALAAMDRAATAFLEASDDEAEEQEEEGEEGAEEGRALRLWGPTALHQLLFVLRADPSIRVRREAMRLLSSVVLAVGSPQEAELLRGVVQRCRDRDDAVRRDAFAMLAQFPQASLKRLLSDSEWRTLLDAGLAGPVPGSGGGRRGGGAASAVACKHAAAIRSTAVQLLRRHLAASAEREGEDWGEAAAGDGGGAEKEEEEMREGDEQSPAINRTGWMHRLRALHPPPTAAAATGNADAVAQHLGAAWAAALQQALSQEQQEVWGKHGSAAV